MSELLTQAICNALDSSEEAALKDLLRTCDSSKSSRQTGKPSYKPNMYHNIL